MLEVGAGSGVSFAYYPQSVTELLAVEPEPNLRVLALEAAHGSDGAMLMGPPHALPPLLGSSWGNDRRGQRWSPLAEHLASVLTEPQP